MLLVIPFFGRFICPLAVARLGFKYFVTNSSERFGHPFTKPFYKAFIIDNILGLRIASPCPGENKYLCQQLNSLTLQSVLAGMKHFHSEGFWLAKHTAHKHPHHDEPFSPSAAWF